MNKKVFLLLAVIVVACGMGFPEKGTEVNVRFTEIIIKLEPDVIVIPEGTYKVPLSEIEIKSEEIEELNREFNLVSIEKMFARKRPGEAEEPELENTFLLKFPDLVEPDAVIDAYEALEEVIYAEENKVVGIF